MSELRVPAAPDVDATWLSAALAAVGGGTRWWKSTEQRIGNGMVADSLRLTLTWDRETDHRLGRRQGSCRRGDNRVTAAATRTYLLEALYRGLADTLYVSRPFFDHAQYER